MALYKSFVLWHFRIFKNPFVSSAFGTGRPTYTLISESNKDMFGNFIIDYYYGMYYEKPEKACERYIFHVMAYVFLYPKIEEFHFRFRFCLKIDHVFFWYTQFFLSDSENGAFQKTRQFYDFWAFIGWIPGLGIDITFLYDRFLYFKNLYPIK